METKQATSDKSERLIDANALKVKAWADDVTGEGMVYVADIDDAPTVDAVEVVRCKVCEHCKTEQVTIPGPYPSRSYTMYTCSHPKQEFGSEPLDVEPDDFCSYGERRASDG